MTSSKKTKLTTHGDTNMTKAVKRNAINKKIKPQIDIKAKEIKKAVDLLKTETIRNTWDWAEKAAKIGDKAQQEYWQAFWDEVGVDNDPGIDVPLHARGLTSRWNFEKQPMSLPDKITWVLTAVNVAILISLIVKNW